MVDQKDVKFERQAERETRTEFKELDSAARHLSSCLRSLSFSNYSRADTNRSMGFSKRSASETANSNFIKDLKKAIGELNAAKKHNSTLKKFSQHILRRVHKFRGHGKEEDFLTHGERRVMVISNGMSVRLNHAVSSLEVAVDELKHGMFDAAKSKIDRAYGVITAMSKSISRLYKLEKQLESALSHHSPSASSNSAVPKLKLSKS